MSIRWPYCRTYEAGVHPDDPVEYTYVRPYFFAKESEREKRLVYHTSASLVAQDQAAMDGRIRRICRVVFFLLAICALVAIGYAIGVKYKVINN